MRRVLTIVAAGFLAGPAQAVVIYDNFGPGDAFNAGSGYTISGGASQGIQFTAGATGYASSVDVGMGVVSFAVNGPQTVSFDLYADSGANTLGALLESFTVLVENSFSSLGVSSGVLGGSTLLTAGQQYWLIAASPSGVNVPWNFNSIGETGLRWSNGLIVSSILATVRVNANDASLPVAEPLTTSLLAFGLLGLGLVSRRRG